MARAIAVEFAPYGVRCNIVQAGVTDTPALRARSRAATHLQGPGAAAQSVRPPHDARATSRTSSTCSATDEAAWINGELIRVDGGEHISGAIA